MILRRLGNKTKIAKEIQTHFPPHKIYIEPFFGAGGMFFNKPKAKYNIVNDIDSDVFNLFQVVSNQHEELKKEFYKMPVHVDLLNYWKDNKEKEPLKKALRFLLMSNFMYLGNNGSLRFGLSDEKEMFYKYIDKTFEFIYKVQFNNCNAIDFIKSIGWRGDMERDKALIYCDPPYLSTGNNYSNSFTEADSNDLFDCLQATGCKWAMSEFDHPFILQQAKERNLNVTQIGERQNLKNRRIEILVTNYKNALTLF